MQILRPGISFMGNMVGGDDDFGGCLFTDI